MYFCICYSCICGADPKVVSRGRKAAAKSWVRLLTSGRPIELTICARPVSSSWTGVGLLGLVLLCQRTKSEEETLCSAFAVSMKIKTLKALFCLLWLTGETTGASHIWQISWMTVLSTYDPQCNGVLKVEGRKKEATLTFMVYQPAVPWARPEATYYLTGQTVCKRSPTHIHTVGWGETVTRVWVSGVFALSTVFPASVQNKLEGECRCGV